MSYNYSISGDKAKITRYSEGSERDIVIPAEISEGEKTYSVTSIGDNAFVGCSGIRSVKIPDTVTSIGTKAFCDCFRLNDISIPESVKSISDWAFSGCSGLKTISLPRGLESLGNYAFRDCVALEDIAIPEGLKTVPFAAFYNCNGLKKISIHDGVEKIDNYAFYTPSPYQYAFYKFSKLKSIDCRPLSTPEIGGAKTFDGISSDVVLTVQTNANGYDREPWSKFKVKQI